MNRRLMKAGEKNYLKESNGTKANCNANVTQVRKSRIYRINEVFFWEETLLSFQDDVHLSRIPFFKQAYRKNYCSSLETRYLFGKNVSFWLSSWKLLSFTQEWKFVFKWIVLHKRWTLLVWRITLKSILAVKVFVLF